VEFDWTQFINDIPHVVRAMDNVIDESIYPLPQQKLEAQNKRRMGIGVTGLANTGEALGYPYGSASFLDFTKNVMAELRNRAYLASVDIAIEKGPFPLFDAPFLDSGFALTLPEHIRDAIYKYGIRNSHLLSIAPTGTISLTADNISSGIEPVFSLEYNRDMQHPDGKRVIKMVDYAYATWGIKGRTADKLDVMDHVNVLNVASHYVDSACSKTCNVGDDVSWETFKDVYMAAYDGGASGCTTFRASGKRFGILNANAYEEDAVEPEVAKEDFITEGTACYYDPSTGLRTCE